MPAKKRRTKINGPANVRAIPTGFGTVTPYLTVRGGTEAIDFYKKAFGAKELERRCPMERYSTRESRSETRLS